MSRWKLLRYILLVLILYGLGRYVWEHADEFQVIRRLDTQVFIALWILHLMMFGLMVASFYRVVRAFGLPTSFFSWARIYSTSRLLSTFAPQAANAYRMAELKISYGFALSSYIGAFGVFTLLGRTFTLFFAVVTILVLDADLRLGGVLLAPVLLVGAASLSALVLGAALLQQRYHLQIRRLLMKLRAKPTVADDMLMLLRRPDVYVYVFVLTLANFFLSLVSHRLAFLAIGTEPGYAELSVLRLSRSVLDVFPVTPGNLGVAEAVYGSLSEGMVIPASAGIIVSGILTVVSTAAIVTVFAIYALLRLWRPLRRRRNSDSAANS